MDQVWFSATSPIRRREQDRHFKSLGLTSTMAAYGLNHQPEKFYHFLIANSLTRADVWRMVNEVEISFVNLGLEQ